MVFLQKRKLKAEIDALELLVASNPKNVGYRVDLDKLKTTYRKLANRRPVSYSP